MSSHSEKEKLFDIFPGISTEEWEALILNDLKGANYEKKLVWKTDGLKVKPYYRAEHIQNSFLSGILPGNPPYVRGNKNDNNWTIREDISDDQPKEANRKALYAIQKGAQSLALNVSACQHVNDLVNLLRGINPAQIPVHFYGASSYLQLADLLVLAAQELEYDTTLFKGSFNFDCLGYFLNHNTFYASPDSNFAELSLLLKKAKRDFPLIKVITVNSDLVHNTGGSLTQEIAYALAIGTEYLTQLTSKGLDADDVAERIQFNLAIGSNYFLEIAKIRAARLLWYTITSQFKTSAPKSQYMTIHSVTSMWNKTIFDPYVNMLRCTTEAMSAAIGGCDSMSVMPFDVTFKKSDNLSERIARNLQIILKEEAYFNKIVDISAGSYYIENLTDIIAEAAWQLFKVVEDEGGYIESAQNGSITSAIEKNADIKEEELATRKVTLLGTNQYPNYTEKMLEKIEPVSQLNDLKNRKNRRLARHFEALRLATEDYVIRGNDVPTVFLFSIGNLGMRKARAGFALNFFACAGYNVLDNNGFKTVQEGLDAALASKANIITLCSSDDEYETLGIEIIEALRKTSPEKIIIVAGNPSCADQLKDAGANALIHVRTNVLEMLTTLNKTLGII